MAHFEEYIEQHRDGGVESEGCFTLDPAGARARLSAYQLPGPKHFLLKLVQAGVAFGCRGVEISCDARKVSVLFLKPERFPEFRDWTGGLDNPLGRRRRAERHLAVGLTAALNLFNHIEWTQPGSSLTVTPEKMEGRPNPEAPSDRMYLEMRSDTNTPLGQWRWISEKCRFSPIPVVINGHPSWDDDDIRGTVHLESYLPVVEGRKMVASFGKRGPLTDQGKGIWLEGKRFFGLSGYGRRALAVHLAGERLPEGPRLECGGRVRLGDPRRTSSTCLPIVDGVILEPIPLESPVKMEIVLAAPDLQRDLSEFQFVRNAAFGAFMGRLRHTVFKAFALASELQLPRLSKNAISSIGETELIDSWCLLKDTQEGDYSDGFRTLAMNIDNPFKLATVTVYPAAVRWDADYLQEFRARLERVSDVRLSGVVRILEHGMRDDRVYTVEQPHRLQDVGHLIREGPCQESLAVDLLASLCRTLRRLKEEFNLQPSGLRLSDLLVEGNRILLRLGRPDPNPRAVQLGEVAARGPTRLMSPEEIGGQRCELSGAYALGTLGYLLTTARLPFEDPDLSALAYKTLTRSPPDPREFSPHLSEELVSLLLRCLTKMPQGRPDYPELERELERVKGRALEAP